MRGEQAGRLGLGHAAEVEQVAGVDDRVDLLVGDDPLHHRVLVRAVHVGDQEDPRGRRLVDLAGHELLLQRLRERKQVPDVRRRLLGPRLHVGEEPRVAAQGAEQAGRGEALQLGGLVALPGAGAGGDHGGDHGEAGGHQVRPVGRRRRP